ncbi:hypothetical protein ABT154_21505 [Streptomyces sp. NPDC001728]|uniref:hypothetical protein n=1 Tax=Streptomyces sp. NPDC001728 TaxID=3154396 RepID=UPI00331C0C6A
MTQTPDRPGIDHLTSDGLDQLYGERDLTRHLLAKVRETSAELINREQLRAERAEATLTAVRAELGAIEQGHKHLDCECEAEASAAVIARILTVLDQHGQTPA